jgi:hypothetical protein
VVITHGHMDICAPDISQKVISDCARGVCFGIDLYPFTSIAAASARSQIADHALTTGKSAQGRRELAKILALLGSLIFYNLCNTTYRCTQIMLLPLANQLRE